MCGWLVKPKTLKQFTIMPTWSAREKGPIGPKAGRDTFMAHVSNSLFRKSGLTALLLTSQVLLCSAALAEEEMTVPGPEGPLNGTFLEAEKSRASVLIIPGSGPVDRDGNSPLGINTNTYKLVAEGLAHKGISSLRIDKRGMFSSEDAIADGNKVTIEDYSDDVRRWAAALSENSGHDCVWLFGHSEGGLVALKAVEIDAPDICGLLLAAAPGRPLGELLREQLQANPANKPFLPTALTIIDALEAGQTVPENDVPAPLKPLFTSGLQAYMTNLFSHDPVSLMRSYGGPALIVQGGQDLQVKVKDATALKEAGSKENRQNMQLLVVEPMAHMLKTVEGSGVAANMATYTNPHLPLSPELVPALSNFISANTTP